jgi:hypothetical protein
MEKGKNETCSVSELLAPGLLRPFFLEFIKQKEAKHDILNSLYVDERDEACRNGKCNAITQDTPSKGRVPR